MSCSLKDERYVNIDDSKFGTKRGVSTAKDQDTGETVIVKGIHLRSNQQWQDAREEAENLKTLDHLNIVKFIDFLDRQTPKWAFGSMCFIIMEFCPAGSLLDWIDERKKRRQKTSVEEAALIGAQLVSGLSYCHGLNRVHLDLKPANVFVMGDGITIKIGDFGSGAELKSMVDSATSTNAWVICNTPLYSPPELYNGEGITKSARLDVWGFGLIIQELITLEHAFGRTNGVLTPHLKEMITNICNGNRDLLMIEGFEEFEELLSRCLSSEKNARPLNAVVLRNEPVFVEFLYRIEAGERPSDIIMPPEEMIRRQREENKKQSVEIKQLEERIKQKEKEIQRLKDEIVAHEYQSKIRDRELERQQSQLNKTEKKYAEAKNEIESLRLTYQEMTENVESEEMKRDQVLATYKKEREDLKRENKRMTAHIKLLETSLTQINSEKTTLEKATARLRSEQDGQKDDNTCLSAEMKQLDISLKEKDSKIKLLSEENLKKETGNQKLMDDFKIAVLDIQRLKTERDDLYHVLDEYRYKEMKIKSHESRHAIEKGEKKPQQSATDSRQTGIPKTNRSRR